MAVGTGCTQGAAHLGAEKPVQDGDGHKAENHQNQNGVVQDHIAHIARGNQQIVFIHADGQVRLAAAGTRTHNAQVDRVQRQLGQDAGKDRGDAAGGVEKPGHKPRQHTGGGGGDQRQPHGYAVEDQHDTDRTAGTQGTVHGQIGNVENPVGQIHADRHNAPDKPLGNGTGHGIDQGSKERHNKTPLRCFWKNTISTKTAGKALLALFPLLWVMCQTDQPMAV